MNPEEYRAPAAGRIVYALGGYAAFVPAPLPPTLSYTPELALALSQADAALGELSGIGRLLPNPHLLIASYIRREAVLSSRIEGTRTSLVDLFLNEAAGDRTSERAGPDAADVHEVRNYVAALEQGLRRLAELPLSLRLVRELHGRLMEGVRGEWATPGEFRRSQNWIGSPGSTLASALYVPPPPEELPEALSNWERFLHQRGTVPDLIQCALLHEQFEAIHPFLDGNGRVGRLLITLFLVERARLSQPLLYLSAYLEAHRQEYYERLQRVRTQGDWLGWLLFFVTAVAVTAREATRQAQRLLELRELLRHRLRDKARALVLVDALFVNPYVSVARAAALLQVSNPTARQAVGLLLEFGVIEEITGRDWGRLYLARPILEAIDPASRTQ
jgi:Fic family protein